MVIRSREATPWRRIAGIGFRRLTVVVAGVSLVAGYGALYYFIGGALGIIGVSPDGSGRPLLWLLVALTALAALVFLCWVLHRIATRIRILTGSSVDATDRAERH